ncbi:transposase [Methylocystis sp. ATCC 49242]|uniref:IS66-like element accessory protein TnpA n=1 Tax=Methylocystis sp. ATCC 49242 TaxID=622637 RepID=UPI001FCDD405|nr:transposase [Methylocystis sp. ATCC 49242]
MIVSDNGTERKRCPDLTFKTGSDSCESDPLQEVRLVSRLNHTLDPKGETVQRIEVITGGRERRRRWSDDEKAEAVEESLQPGVVVSQVARRRGLTPQQLFTWRREARQKAVVSDGVPFAPAVVEPRGTAPTALPSESNAATFRPHVIELDIDGASVWIWRDADIEMVTAIVVALKARS